MTTITFDTLKFVETLEKAGMPREQAAAFSQAQQFSLSEALDSNVATKADLISVKSELKADIVRLDNKIDSMGKDMQSMEQRLTIKLGAFLAVAVGVIISVLRVSH